MNLAGRWISQQCGKRFTQDAASASPIAVGVVLAAAVAAGEDRLGTGARGADDPVVASPGQRPHDLTPWASFGVVVPPAAAANAEVFMPQTGQAVGAAALPAGAFSHLPSPGRRILARIGRKSPIPGPLSLTAGAS